MTAHVLIKLGWPSERLNPNKALGRGWKWSRDARAAAKQEGAVEARLMGANNLKGDKFRLEVTGYLGPRMRGWDDDNLIAALKHHRDGIAQTMGVDDKCFRTVFMGYERAEKARVLIEVIPELAVVEIPFHGQVT